MITLDNRFALEGVLRDGSWGKLLQGRDLELNRTVRAREIKLHSLTGNPEVRHFVGSSFSLFQLNHPGIEQIISIRRADDGTIYIIYDSIRSLSLKGLIRRFADIDLTPDFALYLLSEIAQTLAEAHQQRDRGSGKPLKLYHLGLNPETVFLTESGGVRLGDFALPSTGEIKTADQVAYLSPEQIQGGEADARSDIFSLGVIGYELITGGRLFRQENISELMAKIVKGDYDLPGLSMPSLDSQIGELIADCLRLNRNERLASASEFADRARLLCQDRVQVPNKRIREYVEKFAEPPKLDTNSDLGRQTARTRALTRAEFDEGTKAMSDSLPNENDGERKDRPGQETRITNASYAERMKRAKHGGMGGNKTVLTLGIIAIILLIGVGIVMVKRMLSKGSTTGTTVAELKSGRLTTVPDSAAVYQGDSLIGVTPLTFSAKEGDRIVLKHRCCPDSNIVIDFGQFSSGPISLQAVVEISSNPVGAQIILNDQKIAATTPYRFRAATTDTFQFTLEIPNKPPLNSGRIAVSDIASFSAANFDVTTLAKGAFQISGSFSEKPKTQIVTIPSDATVVMATTGVELGNTPFGSDFGEESVKLTIRKPGYEDFPLELPPLVSRKPSYRVYLIRPVSITAYDERDVQKTVNCRIKSIVYDGKTVSSTETTPATLRLPGVDCRITLSADGFKDTDTLITATQGQITVVMRPLIKKEKIEKEKEQPALTSTEGTGQVKVIVVDNKKAAVEGVSISAEVTRDKKKQVLQLGTTDKEGMLKVNLEPGKYKFITSHPEYKSDDDKQEVKSGDKYVVSLKIKRK